MLSLLLLSSLAIQSVAVMEVQVPDVPVVAMHGRDVLLNCSFGVPGPVTLQDLSVFWQLTDTQRSVHGFWEGRDQLADQAEAFSNRTALFPTRLARGDASLLLRRVEVADEGSYTCFVRLRNYSSAALLLLVAAPYSKPVVTLLPDSNLRPGDAVALTCVAYGGYPAAGVLWQDGGGHNLTENATTSLVANEEGLFSLHSQLSVVLEPNSTYTCRLTHPVLGEESHASVTVTGQNMAFPQVALWVTGALALCLLALLIALAAVCRRKIQESCEEARREAEEAKELEEDESKTAMTPLKS